MRKFKFLFILLVFFKVSPAQELKAKITIISNQVGGNVNQRIFRTLQSSLHTFINTRKWTTDKFEPNERIECQFLFNLQPTEDVNIFTASITVQAARPAFNTSYLSPIINFKDDNVIFKYVEFQQLEFNENRVTGSDALVSNLTAVMAYYANMIIAFDYASFSLHGGDPYFQKAQNIVNNAPDGRGVSGWKAFDGPRNRYWLVANMLSSRYAVMHDVYYNYYRLGMDKLYEDENAARAEVLNVLNLLNNFNTENPNTMINQFFFQGKSTELVKIFSKAPPQDKIRASELLQKLDITNATKYKDELK